MNKKRLHVLAALALTALLLVSTLVLSGCGFAAKNLAKQTNDLTRRVAELQKKAAEIEVKAANLSERDRRAYREEMARMGVEEEPEWLFDDTPGIFSIAQGDSDADVANEVDDDTGGGFLGGLARMVRGLGNKGGGSRGGNSSDTDDTDAGADSSGGGFLGGIFGGNKDGGESGGGNTGGNAAGIGKRTAAVYGIFESGTYHMKMKTTVEGMEVIGETYVKGGMIATVSETAGMSVRSVHRDGRVYAIMDQMSTVMIMRPTADNTPAEPVRTAGLAMTGSGTARFNGKNLPYEEYTLTDSDVNAKIQYFFDGNSLAGIRNILEGQTIDMIILEMDQNVPNSVFEIPAGYQKIEM